MSFQEDIIIEFRQGNSHTWRPTDIQIPLSQSLDSHGLFLSPLVQQLNDISEDVYQKVSDDPHEEINQLVDQGIEVDDIQFRNPTGESKRDLMRKEVSSYIYKHFNNSL